jgi:enoyl-CoA hydratase/carnithine racemase
MDDVQFGVDNTVATLILNRPEKLNAVTAEMTEEIRRHVGRVDRDPSIRVLVFAGAGERAFCAGSDIRELDAYDSAWEFRERPDYCDAVRKLRKPVIAAVNGYAFGGGLELALSCDIRLASSNASFAAPEIKLGWVGGGGMSALLTHSIGPSNAATMVYTGDPIDSAQALDWGLVSSVVAPQDLLGTARELADRVAARPPVAVQTGKLNLRAAYSMPLENCIQYERDLQTICFATADAAEGRAAFKDKRQATFRGR